MTKKQANRLSDEIRAAIKNCGMSRYRISKETGIDPAALCRFAQGKMGLTTDTLDKLAECIGLHVLSEHKPRAKKGG